MARLIETLKLLYERYRISDRSTLAARFPANLSE